MGIMDFFNKLRKEKGIESSSKDIKSPNLTQRDLDSIVNEYMAKNSTRFANAGPQDFVFIPADGDVLRMKLLGCIAGDEYIDLKTGKHIQVERDEIERFEYIPKQIKYNDPTIADSANRARMYMRQYTYGDVIKDKIFTYEYAQRKIEPEIDESVANMRYSLVDEYAYEGYEYYDNVEGFAVTCHEKDKPLKDVYIRSGIGGKNVIDISNCFADCKNLVSIKSFPLYEPMIKTNCFKGSGLTEIPAALREYARQSAKCPSSYKGIFAGCYNLAGIGKEFINPAFFIGDKTIIDMLYAKMEMEKIKEMYDGLKAFIDGKESRIKAVESVSFVYKFEPVEITRIQMGSRWYVMNGNEMQEYNQYMEQHFKNKEDISGLQAGSFSRENEKELAQELCDKQLQKLEKAQAQYEMAFSKLSKAQSEFKPLCDKAQSDTKERTDAVNRNDDDAR